MQKIIYVVDILPISATGLGLEVGAEEDALGVLDEFWLEELHEDVIRAYL